MDNNAKLVHKKCSKACDKDLWKVLWHKPCAFYKPRLVGKLWTMLVIVGSTEITVGTVLLIVMLLYSQEFDEMYSTENNKAISSSTFIVLVTLSLTGMILLISLILERRRLLLIYILLSTIVCMYIFALSAFEIYFGILRLRRDAYKRDAKNKLLNTPCVLGILTMLGSVVHFIGVLVVITFYNFKFIQPRLNTYQLTDN